MFGGGGGGGGVFNDALDTFYLRLYGVGYAYCSSDTELTECSVDLVVYPTLIRPLIKMC